MEIKDRFVTSLIPFTSSNLK